MKKRHFYDGLMYYPQQLQQCSCSFIIEFMNWYFMWFLRACVDPLHTLMWAPSWCTWGSVQTVRPHYLQNTHTLGILGGLASQFSCYRLIRFRLNYSHRCTAMTFNYCHFSRVNLLFISNVFFFQDFISSKGSFLWGGPIKLRNLFTTLLALTRLLDFEVTTLPYPTRSWKLLLVGAWP